MLLAVQETALLPSSITMNYIACKEGHKFVLKPLQQKVEMQSGQQKLMGAGDIYKLNIHEPFVSDLTACWELFAYLAGLPLP